MQSNRLLALVALAASAGLTACAQGTVKVAPASTPVASLAVAIPTAAPTKRAKGSVRLSLGLSTQRTVQEFAPP